MKPDREIMRLVRDYREGTAPRPHRAATFMEPAIVKYHRPTDPAFVAVVVEDGMSRRPSKFRQFCRKVCGVLCWTLIIAVVLALMAVSFLAETFRWGFSL